MVNIMLVANIRPLDAHMHYVRYDDIYVYNTVDNAINVH